LKKADTSARLEADREIEQKGTAIATSHVGFNGLFTASMGNSGQLSSSNAPIPSRRKPSNCQYLPHD